MKKSILLLIMLCAFLLANAQEVLFVDDAVQGTIGSHQQQYVGTWVHNSTSPDFYKGTLSYSNTMHDYILITFVGNHISWTAEKKNTHGYAAVSLDGGSERSIDLYSATPQRPVVYESPNTLQQGTHTLKIRVMGIKNAASTGTYIVHDHFYIGQYIPPRNLPDISDTRFGESALPQLNGGINNTAIGYAALEGTWFGNDNTALGAYAAGGVDKGSFNTAVGSNAFLGGGAYTSSNTAVGYQSIEFPGEGNTAIGVYAGPSVPDLWYSTAVGAGAKNTADNQVRIGSSSVTSIGGQVSWSTLSDGRFKRDIKEDVSGLEFINGLRPVSYTVDNGAVAKFLRAPEVEQQAGAKEKTTRQTGFVAQEVDALVKKSRYVFNGVDAPQNENDPYTIRYAEFVVPLVKAVQELTTKVEEQQIKIDAQQEQLDLLRQAGGRNDVLSTAAGAVLYQNNPNPFSTDTNIEMTLPESAHQVNVIVYNLEGKEIKDVLVTQRGQSAVTIPGHELTPGMYLYALIIDGKVIDTKRMVLTK
jgi:hypothetical protein